MHFDRAVSRATVRAMRTSIGAGRSLCFLLLGLSILVLAQRSPAPIVQEVKPTPAAEESEAPKKKPSTKLKSSSSENEEATTQKSKAPSASATKFAGAWSGTLQTFPWGNWQVTLTVDGSESNITEQVNQEKSLTRTAKRNGEMLQARFP